MSLNLANLISSIFFIFFGAWFLTGALGLPKAMNSADVGPGAFPLMLSILIIVCAFIVIIQTVININKGYHERIFFNKIMSVLTFATLLLIYTFLIPKISYYFSTALIFPLLMIASGEKSWKKVIMITAGFMIFAKLAFDILMGVPLP